MGRITLFKTDDNTDLITIEAAEVTISGGSEIRILLNKSERTKLIEACNEHDISFSYDGNYVTLSVGTIIKE